uniref:Uncharacterized protein n=1 Tax=Romanomermis culicivorax TaxID=13658 RepID=A0A915HKB5_ROMCU
MTRELYERDGRVIDLDVGQRAIIKRKFFVANDSFDLGVCVEKIVLLFGDGRQTVGNSARMLIAVRRSYSSRNRRFLPNSVGIMLMLTE